MRGCRRQKGKSERQVYKTAKVAFPGAGGKTLLLASPSHKGTGSATTDV